MPYGTAQIYCFLIEIYKAFHINCLSVDKLSRNGIMGYQGPVAKPESHDQVKGM